MTRTRVQVLIALTILLAGALLVPAGRAAAHAAFDHSTPAKDEVVAAPPSQVDVYFKEEVFKQAGSNFVRVFDDTGAQVGSGDGTVDDNDRTHISAALPVGLANGRYVVRWMTTSDEDQETDQGAFCFYIGVSPTVAQQAQCASLAPTPVPTIAATQPTSVATTVAVTPSPTSDDTAKAGGGGSNTGVIIGVVAGVIAVVVVVGGAALWWRSRRT